MKQLSKSVYGKRFILYVWQSFKYVSEKYSIQSGILMNFKTLFKLVANLAESQRPKKSRDKHALSA